MTLEERLAVAEDEAASQREQVEKLEALCAALTAQHTQLVDELDRSARALAEVAELYKLARRQPWAERASRELSQRLGDIKHADTGDRSVSVWLAS